MKFLVSAALLALSVNAFAEAKRDIYDLMYLPTQGTIFGSTEANYVKAWGDIKSNVGGGDLGDFDVSGYGINQTIGYSVLNNLFITAEMGWSSTDTDLNLDAGDEKFTEDGESDPSFEVRYRVLETEWIVDVLAQALVGTGDHVQGTDDKDGNNKQGGSNFGLAVQVGQKLADGNQWSLLAGVTKIGEATDKEDGVKTKENEHSQWDFIFNHLCDLKNNAFLKTTAGVSFTNKHNDENGVQTEQSSAVKLGAEYQYLMSANLLLRGGVEYATIQNNVVDGVELHKDHAFKFVAGANYQF